MIHNYDFANGFPTYGGAVQANNDSLLARAVTAYKFFYPTVSMEATFQGNRDAGITDNNSALIMATYPHHLLFTGNSDTPYMGGVVNLAETGPLVIDLPKGLFLGIIDDHNFGWVHDLGLPGPDAGNGGKHLILPPNYNGEVPDGYFAAQSKTNYILIAVRALPMDGDMNAALNSIRTVKVYPLSQAANPPEFKFVDHTNDKSVDVTPLKWEYNLRFWEKLHKVLQEEEPIAEWRTMYGELAALGIEKGKPFAPQNHVREILETAAKTGRDQLLVSGFASARDDVQTWADRRWEWATLIWQNGDFETPGSYDLEARDRWFSQAVGMSPKMVLRTMGAGSLYWLGHRDANGEYLDGAKTYKLSIPQPVPAKLFWSVTVYDPETRSQIATDQDKAALRSLVELRDAKQAEPTDLYFGPELPEGVDENHWVKTIPGKGWFTYLRLYGPTEPAFDQSWKPGDFAET